jgi:peptidoglycan/LPS O-acetylase OafA/YrhL
VGTFISPWEFFSLSSATAMWFFLAGLGLLALVALRRLPRSLGWGMLTVLVGGALLAVYFRHRSHGWYFYFKVLAFIGPLVVLLGVVGAASLRRRAAVPVLGLMIIFAWGASDQEIQATGRQLGSPTIALQSFSRAIPTNASVRLDMWPPNQLWAAYFMAAHPLCSAHPLYASDYPRVPTSRAANYVLVHPALNEPPDAVGPPIRLNVGYGLYRLRPGIPPGPDVCSLRRVQKIHSSSLLSG